MEAPAESVGAKPARKPRAAKAKVAKGEKKERDTKSSYAATKGGKEPREDSKRGQLLKVLRGPGITIEAMMKKWDWKVTDCRDALRLLGAQNGIATVRDESGVWRAK